MNNEIFSRRILFCFLLLHLIDGQLQINLYLTDWVNNNENNKDFQHDCLRAVVSNECDFSQLISYCVGEWPSQWNIQENNIDPKFNFAELSKQNVTSQQLYLWSAPMDLIENYQFYLDQLKNSTNTSMATQVFYNCTLPNFGPKCEYMLNDYKSHHLSLNEIIHDYYYLNQYNPTLLTCYMHLECNRGLPPSCLDWSEICDGKIDCLGDGQDEKHCWQLEIYDCNENEYRCLNGQCIPKEFSRDGDYVYDCLDRTDEYDTLNPLYTNGDRTDNICFMPEPTFSNEDSTCTWLIFLRENALTSSCVRIRAYLLFYAIFSVKPKSISDECWTAFKCIIGTMIPVDSICQNLCSDEICDKIVRMTCSDIVYAPAVSILSDGIVFGYETNSLYFGNYQNPESTYVCYNNQLFHLPNENKTRSLSKNVTCRPCNTLKTFQLYLEPIWTLQYIMDLHYFLKMYTSWIYNDSIVCNKSIMYQCINSSKCISKHRLFNAFQDCPYNDDEDMSMWDKNCSIKRNSMYFKCEKVNECIPLHLRNDRKCDCTSYSLMDNDMFCDDEQPDYHSKKITITFQIICDNLTDLYPIAIDGEYQTDETECDQWPCNNIYTRCDGLWQCFNGIDELNCHPLTGLTCPSNNHICISFETKNLMCLPIEKANDGKIDCLGAADEPMLCQVGKYENPVEKFYCKNNVSSPCLHHTYLCDNISHCTNEEDELNCNSDDLNRFKKFIELVGICGIDYSLYDSDILKTLCKSFLPSTKGNLVEHFKLGEIQSSSKVDITHLESRILPRQSIIQTIQYYQQRCHRGLDIQIWLNKEKNLTINVCFCPPSFYGDICQYQNQRVSLTIKFRTPSDSVQIPFVIIISFIDDSEERIIHSYEKFTYISKYHCGKKFHNYLLYSTRPKNPTKNYSVHIDIYEQDSFKYRRSFIKPILFVFLPVHRLSLLLNIPRIGQNIDSCSDHRCINGKCRIYFNDTNNTTFCQCNQGWSGRYCTIKYTCNCSSDSLCLGLLANNRSLCVCPLNKIGARCLLNDSICQNEKHKQCLNGGQCIIVNQYETLDKQFICICPKGFYGQKCEINESKIIVSFSKDIVLPFSTRIHFIDVIANGLPDRQTTFKTIPFGQTSITIYWKFPFNIIFIELTPRNYYLTFIENDERRISLVETILHPSNHCLHIDELFNKTIVNYSLIRRIKYYNIPCRTNLSCFYDDIHLCLCQDHDQQRLANCFNFDHNMQMNCSGASACENGGECFQDDSICPQTTLCVCPSCFYGTRCQLSTYGYSLSLDAILGYHIRLNVNISRQPIAVLLSLIISILITLFGIANGIVLLITFKDKKARGSGCGIYLFCSSFNTLLTMIIFTLKVWILVFSQMKSITNQSFLSVQCYSIDFLLRFCLTMDQWLTTCVAIERAYIIIKGVNFNQKKIRLIAKWVIVGLLLIIIGTTIHDPIYRRLIEEENDEEKRIWCIVEYPSAIHIVNLVIIIFHTIIPFIINLISAIIIIIMNARQRAIMQKEQKYKTILHEQIQQHKNLVIGPIVLIILGIPRLIISFVSGCMKSPTNSWLFLFGYFISLIPSLLTFILFVLPSNTYYQIFYKAVSRYRNGIRTRS